MENFSENLKKLGLNKGELNETTYEYINVFKNPNNLPINNVHLNKTTIDLNSDIKNIKLQDNTCVNEPKKYFTRKIVALPALDKSWLPISLPIYNYSPYTFIATTNENQQFSNNKSYLETLNYLLKCNYHQFWCSILFENDIVISLHSFLLNPLLSHEISKLNDNNHSLYETVLETYLLVYKRLLTFKESKSEYMSEQLGLQYLIEKKLLNLPIVITLAILYEKIDLEFINKLTTLYFCDITTFQEKEIEEFINQFLMTLEMLGGYICGFDENAIIIPIAIDEKPKLFNSNWVYSFVNYLLMTVTSLHVLLKFYHKSIQLALDKNIPYRLTYTYENVFTNLYEYLENRQELNENYEFAQLIYETIAFSRSRFIEIYNIFVTNCLAKTLEFQDDKLRQDEYIEVYLKLMTIALDDEYFICDYNEIYNIEMQNEMFCSCNNTLDTTRTDYIVTCINNFPRHNRLKKYKLLQKCNRNEIKSIENSASGIVLANHEIDEEINKLNDEEIDDLIKIVVDMFPHLGDGFVLKCLEAYNYETNDVISAILEENLPPHIIDLPFDLIRIPPEIDENDKIKPILTYKGKKPDYNDTLNLLNDKKDMKKIKTYILDGFQYTNEYEDYDDEYDDRLDEETINLPDTGTEDVLKLKNNENYDGDIVSDTSYSSNDEFDENGELIKLQTRKKLDFCENPELARARRENRYRSKQQQQQQSQKPTTNRNVVGKPKGQGQDKAVLQNRQNKNVNKSSRANHNRKSGAQWKRNKGMIPS